MSACVRVCVGLSGSHAPQLCPLLRGWRGVPDFGMGASPLRSSTLCYVTHSHPTHPPTHLSHFFLGSGAAGFDSQFPVRFPVPGSRLLTRTWVPASQSQRRFGSRRSKLPLYRGGAKIPGSDCRWQVEPKRQSQLGQPSGRPRPTPRALHSPPLGAAMAQQLGSSRVPARGWLLPAGWKWSHSIETCLIKHDLLPLRSLLPSPGLPEVTVVSLLQPWTLR